MKNRIIELLNETAKGQATNQVFFDWVTMTAISIANRLDVVHGDVYQERENTYLSINRRYTAEQLENFCEMTGLLANILDEEPTDVLGDIYHKLNTHNPKTGQFFTPFHICKMLASFEEYKDEPFEVNEPSCGAGGNMLGIANVMKSRGQDYMQNLKVVAQDLDWNCIYMCYVQLSLAGIKATVIQGDTLAEKKPMQSQIFRTPALMIY